MLFSIHRSQLSAKTSVQLVIIINIIFLKGLLNKCASGLEREQ